MQHITINLAFLKERFVDAVMFGDSHIRVTTSSTLKRSGRWLERYAYFKIDDAGKIIDTPSGWSAAKGWYFDRGCADLTATKED